jgi:hypothetical protein
MEGDKLAADRARRRLRAFIIHLVIYFATMTVLLPINFIYTPRSPWILFLVVGWGAPLALHAAWAMGLFDRLRK